MPSLPLRSKRPKQPTLKRRRPPTRITAQPKIPRPTTEKIRKTAITALKVNVSLTPANPKMDPVKTVRNAITDGTNLKEPETLRSVANAENEANVDVVAAEGPEVDAVENEEAVVAAEVESVISIANPEMTRRVSNPWIRKREVGPTIGVPTRTK